MVTKVLMEALSPTMEEGKVLSWLKHEGDQVGDGDVLAEVETDKAVMELQSRGAGVLRKILAGAGATVEVGTGRRTKAEVINYALLSLRLGPTDLSRVVMVGDRDHDVEGAHLNGIDCIGVTWGFGSVDELDGAGAALTVDHPREVAAAVAASYRSVRP